jgi:hypothetical protein
VGRVHGRRTGNLTRLSMGSGSPRALIRPHRRCSARGKGKNNTKHSKTFSIPPRGSYLWPSARREVPHSKHGDGFQAGASDGWQAQDKGRSFPGFAFHLNAALVVLENAIER